MLSTTAQMISTNQAWAAMMAKKLSEVEGVPYEIVKEAKGYRVVAVKAAAPAKLDPKLANSKALADALKTTIAEMTGKLKQAGMPSEAVDALGGVAAVIKTLDPPVIHNKIDQSDAYMTFQFELRKSTPTMLQVVVNGQPRAFDKAHLLDWSHKGGASKLVTLKMTPAQAKKWKLTAIK
jgi:hypothetical protein